MTSGVACRNIQKFCVAGGKLKAYLGALLNQVTSRRVGDTQNLPTLDHLPTSGKLPSDHQLDGGLPIQNHYKNAIWPWSSFG
jgi:hypothetical protein